MARRLKHNARPTIGFLSTWSVYEGTTIDNYAHVLLQGICTAAREQDCNLLLGCGIDLPGSPHPSRTVWAVPGSGVDFVPVGPWNTDGLIVIPTLLSETQFEYLQDLIRSSYPIILTTAEKPGPLLAVDNAGGIRQAFNHLWQHGHRRIAFIAGKSGRGGDSAERLAAYRQALREAGLEEDGRLIAFGEHRREGGRNAMRQILTTGAPFTAVLASNDLSCLGAIEVLRAAGRRIPDDVATIGFDDILETCSHLPPLTTIRHPIFALGYQAVLTLLDRITNGSNNETHLRLPTQLVIRQSCGCRPESVAVPALIPATSSNPETVQSALAKAMAEAALVEVKHTTDEEIKILCLNLIHAFTASLSGQNPALFDAEMQRLCRWLETHDEDAYAWQAALTTLRNELYNPLPLVPEANPAFAALLIDRARLELSEHLRRQAAGTLLRHVEMSNRLGLMTAQLLAALDATEIAHILADHLPQVGIQHALVALYVPGEDDPFARCTVLLDVGSAQNGVGRQFSPRDFPLPGLYPSESAFQLAILPLLIDPHTMGFVTFSATNFEPCATIVHNLASALRTGRLYLDAVEGRRLAEEANRLKSRFLSIVSHELRTPLSLIVGLSDMVLQEQRDYTALSDTALRDIKQIHLSARHLGRLIGDVLDLASSEAGQLRLLAEPLDLTEVLSATAQIGEQLAHEKGLTWRAHLPRPGPRVLGDRTRLRQIVLNLISNAVKFTASGTVMLEVKLNAQQTTVLVSDTGPGIPPAEQESIFRELERSERTTLRLAQNKAKAGFGGLGLGLAICKQLVEKHGGTIEVRSPGDLGQGATFFFTLPVISAANVSSDPAATRLLTPGHVVVLTEDSEDGDRLGTHLRERGFEVKLFHTAPATDWLTPLLAASPAALILDQKTALHYGWALLDRLKRQPPAEHLPVLVYSLDFEKDRGEWLELNYLHKPLAPDQLIEQLARLGGTPARRVVLVVDDDPDILDLHCRLVEQAGCRPLRARHGREALELLEHTHPDLILLDLMMPEVDGFAVLDALRSRDTTRDIRVIVLTARVLDEAAIERLNRGVAVTLNKGLFSATETLRHIEMVLARQQTLGSATQRLVRQAMVYIHLHFAQSFSREDIASHVGFSADYLTDCFRQELGVTPMVYLNRYRIHRACELLENSDLSITQIAFAVGFSASAHFTRAFQREIGVTPRAYRQGERGRTPT